MSLSVAGLMTKLLIINHMNEGTLMLMDAGLYGLHLLLIGFNLTGWIWQKTRPWHLLTVGVTILSWFALGYWYGFGYCMLTDWQWQVKHALGQQGLPGSFIDHLLNGLIGFGIAPAQVDLLTGGLFAIAVAIAILLNIRDIRLKKA